jgi:hypothetical protein
MAIGYVDSNQKEHIASYFMAVITFYHGRMTSRSVQPMIIVILLLCEEFPRIDSQVVGQFMQSLYLIEG